MQIQGFFFSPKEQSSFKKETTILFFSYKASWFKVKFLGILIKIETKPLPQMGQTIC